MILSIFFDGKEVVIHGPSENLIRSVTSPSAQKYLGIHPGDNPEAGHNCQSALVFPTRATGKTVDMWIKRDSISAHRLAEATSQGNAR